MRFFTRQTWTFLISALTLTFSNYLLGQADACGSAPAISDGVTAFSTIGFSGSNESSCGGTGDTADGWFIYTASCTGDVTVSTCNDANFDTTLSIFDGCLGSELNCNDDFLGCVDNTSETTFAATSGTQYWVRIAGWSGATGTGNITIECDVGNDDCGSALTVSDGTTAFSTIGFTGSNESSCAGSGDTADGWYVYTASCTGDVTVSTCSDASFDTSLSAFDGCGGTELACNDDTVGCSGNTSEITFSATAGTQYWIRIAGFSGATGTGNLTISCSPANDDCASAEAISDGTTAFSTVGYSGTNESSCGGTGDTADGWYLYTASCTGDVTVSTCSDASFDTTLSAFDGCGGTELACNDDEIGCSGNTSEITFAVISGTQYWIRIAGFSGATGTGNITISCSPDNDDCAFAEAISDGTTAFSTVGFSGTNESSCAGTGDTADGWYVYTASCTGDVTVSTCSDATFDTTLSAFDGCGGTELACNDDETGCSGNTSEITFSVTSGTQYWIRIAGFSGATGTGNITINCVIPAPANDLCANAIAVTNPSTNSGTTVNATDTGEPPTCVTSVTVGGVWYTYTSNATEEVTLSLCGAPYDSKIGVYTGSCGSFTCVIGEDDDFINCGGNDPSVTFTTTATFAPVTYYIYVHGFDNGQGTFELVLSAILPVELGSFEGKVMKDYNLLSWETLTEANTEMHQIERSLDGRDDWKMIGEVRAVGNSSETSAYSLHDTEPVPVAYYRLKSVDFGGYTEYSEIIQLQRETDDVEILNISPNPTSDQVNINFFVPSNGNYIIMVTNIVGQVLVQEQRSLDTGNYRESVDLSRFDNGIYLISISNTGSSSVHKIVKQ
ncbi:MAG: T9SS type A sorting domain-containing protein [Bacteroidota bacterium]